MFAPSSTARARGGARSRPEEIAQLDGPGCRGVVGDGAVTVAAAAAAAAAALVVAGGGSPPLLGLGLLRGRVGAAAGGSTLGCARRAFRPRHEGRACRPACNRHVFLPRTRTLCLLLLFLCLEDEDFFSFFDFFFVFLLSLLLLEDCAGGVVGVCGVGGTPGWAALSWRQGTGPNRRAPRSCKPGVA